MYLSIITTLYNSAEFIVEFHRRASEVAATISTDYEIIYVNDGSADGSLEIARSFIEKDDHVRVVEFSRNFGHHAAIFAAMESASGKLVFLIDSDLEESPEWLLRFVDVMDKEKADLVYGVQQKRPGGLRQNTSGLFYSLFNALSETKIPKNVCTVRLMTGEFNRAVIQMPEKNLFMAGMFAWTGFQQIAVPVDKKPRPTGESTYTLSHLFKLLVDAITSFSPLPLYFAFFLGLAIATVAGAFGTLMIVRKLLFPETILLGFTSVVTSMFFIGGLVIFFLGVIGIYLSKIFTEVKARPLYVVKRRYGFSKNRNESSK